MLSVRPTGAIGSTGRAQAEDRCSICAAVWNMHLPHPPPSSSRCKPLASSTSTTLAPPSAPTPSGPTARKVSSSQHRHPPNLAISPSHLPRIIQLSSSSTPPGASSSGWRRDWRRLPVGVRTHPSPTWLVMVRKAGRARTDARRGVTPEPAAQHWVDIELRAVGTCAGRRAVCMRARWRATDDTGPSFLQPTPISLLKISHHPSASLSSLRSTGSAGRTEEIGHDGNGRESERACSNAARKSSPEWYKVSVGSKRMRGGQGEDVPNAAE